MNCKFFFTFVYFTDFLANVQVYVINAMDPQADVQRFCERVPEVQYFLEHHHGYFYILTNAPPTNKDEMFSGTGYYLARCVDEDLQLANMQVILAF